ncbi:unnamed protein product [Pleuronectes platessa]|uniref:Extensin-like n=1 Tax=Pleuronectes platessa TaxID=8262 RepID=A0A9N7Y0P8_PLEPL|nr:unnamed protein product [Pleuronectes platessa]
MAPAFAFVFDLVHCAPPAAASLPSSTPSDLVDPSTDLSNVPSKDDPASDPPCSSIPRETKPSIDRHSARTPPPMTAAPRPPKKTQPNQTHRVPPPQKHTHSTAVTLPYKGRHKSPKPPSNTTQNQQQPQSKTISTKISDQYNNITNYLPTYPHHPPPFPHMRSYSSSERTRTFPPSITNNPTHLQPPIHRHTHHHPISNTLHGPNRHKRDPHCAISRPFQSDSQTH